MGQLITDYYYSKKKQSLFLLFVQECQFYCLLETHISYQLWQMKALTFSWQESFVYLRITKYIKLDMIHLCIRYDLQLSF